MSSMEIADVLAINEVDSEGRVVLCCAANLTLYFRDGYIQSKREAVLEAVNEYFELAGGGLRWWVTEGGKFGKVSSLIRMDMSKYLLSHKYEKDPDLNWAFLWHGGKGKDEASSIRIEGLGATRMECELHGGLSYIRASFPLTFANVWDVLPRLAIGWANKLNPVHGYGGVAMVVAADEGLAAVHEGLVVTVSQRFPGIDVDSPLDHALWTKAGIKGGSWLTVLSASYVDELGGLQQTEQALGPKFALLPFAGGVAIKAGDVPEIGDRNRRIHAPLLSRLAIVLRPIRVTGHPGIRTSPAGYDRQKFEAWLSRFDLKHFS